MRISDWSSDVCSSDLGGIVERFIGDGEPRGEPLVLVGQQQRLEHVAPHGVVRAEVVVVRVERRRLGRDSNGQLLRGGRRGQHRGEGDRAKQRALSHEFVPRKTLKRSEEHTSELQSLMRISYAVFCLKKKNIEET